MNLSVIGCGYLGAVHAACMAHLGHTVVGYDVDAAKVDALNSGLPPFHEPGLPELLEKVLADGSLRFTADIEDLSECDVHFLCVGTPQKRGELAADLTFVNRAFDALVPYLHPESLVVGKSTVPVGTAEELASRLVAQGSTAVIAWNPEFLREGHAIADTLEPDRLVYGLPAGAAGSRAREILDSVYAQVASTDTPVVVTDLGTSQLVKVAANAFLATKISFINAMAEFCEVTGGDVAAVADAIGFDERIGRRFLNAGLGFGGGCLPKDIRAFMARAGELGVDQALSFLREVDSINMRRRVRMVDLAREECGGSVSGRRIAVLGASFKPDSDDIRDSPALSVAEQMRLQGAHVVVTDPAALPKARVQYPDLSFADSVYEAVSGADLVLVLTEWTEYRAIEPADLAPHVGATRILDGRNALDPEKWRSAGWTYRALGRP